MEMKLVKPSPCNLAPRLSGFPVAWRLLPVRAEQKVPRRLLVTAEADRRLQSVQKPPIAHTGLEKKRVDESQSLTLDSIRHSLIRQEDSIIFSLLERAQYCYNPDTYDHNVFYMDGFQGSLVEFMVCETERLHAQVGRYKSPDEHPFFVENLPEPMLPPMQYPKVLHPIADSININKKIWGMYFGSLLPKLVKDGSDGNCGSSAVCDTICLQALSKRIHYGKFVAEAKYRASPELFEAAIRAQDGDLILQQLTYETVESAIKERVEMKARVFGQEFVGKSDGRPPACCGGWIKRLCKSTPCGDLFPAILALKRRHLIRMLALAPYSFKNELLPPCLMHPTIISEENTGFCHPVRSPLHLQTHSDVVSIFVFGTLRELVRRSHRFFLTILDQLRLIR